ncbi:hypothetical protein F5877DRAFT_71728, partial [Lentinula edodes]
PKFRRVNVLRAFKGARTLDIEGWVPVFKDGDASNERLSIAISHFEGPVRFLKFSRRLPNLRVVKLSDHGLVRGEVNELDLQLAKVKRLEVKVYASDKETLCVMLAVMKDVRELKVKFCDDVNEPDELLGSIADMLDFNPPIERLWVTADDPFVNDINHRHLRTLKALCRELKEISIGDRRWKTKQGFWIEEMDIPSNRSN